MQGKDSEPQRAVRDGGIGQTGDGLASGFARRVPREHDGNDVPSGPHPTRVTVTGTQTLPDSLQGEHGHRATGTARWSGPADDAGTKPPSQRDMRGNSATEVAARCDRHLCGRQQRVRTIHPNLRPVGPAASATGAERPTG
jgi:hypothetical protein